MSNTKHTPGIWHVDGHNLTAVISETTKEGITQDWKTYKHVCDCNYGYEKPEENFEENKANAKLIAAAPELLEALKLNSEMLDMLILATPTGEERNAFCNLNIITKAAIVKATE